MESEESSRKIKHKGNQSLGWILPLVCFFGLMYLIVSWAGKKLERVEKSWGDRIERGYFLNQAYEKWGTDSLNYYDGNGTLSFRLWKEILYEDDEGDQYYWIALKFDGDTRDSRATSCEISASKEDLGKLIREKYSVRDIYTFLLEAENGDVVAQDGIASMDKSRVSNAQFKLGVFYFNRENKKGNLGDYKEAVKWWRKAAALGHSGALIRLKDTLTEYPNLVED